MIETFDLLNKSEEYRRGVLGERSFTAGKSKGDYREGQGDTLRSPKRKSNRTWWNQGSSAEGQSPGG